MRLEKFEQYHALNDAYSKRTVALFEEITNQMDECNAEMVQELAEMCHKQGFLDGMDFHNWICDKIY